MTEEITKALGPVFQKNPDYETIFPAMCMCMARVIQSTPDRGNELLIMEDAYTEIKHALTQFLAIEHAKEAQAKVVVEGIDGFAGLARPAEQPVIEPGSAADHPDNPNQNVAKTVKPWPEEEPYTEEELQNAPPAGGTINSIVQFGPKHNDPHGVLVEPIAEGGNPGKFGYKVVDGVESPAGPTYDEIMAEEAEQAKQDTYKEEP
jgi:hypothetical protein